MVHHDLWEYDNVGPATLGDITVNGKRIKAVMQPNKNGYLYVLDRVTGEPVWPIVERPVPAVNRSGRIRFRDAADSHQAAAFRSPGCHRR